uniref:Cell division protein ZapB n=1 Tax=Candidatus Kentrum sp. TUN TaxID=2126343 RepID=A0A450ZJM1_9GAMM|nr:MAG: cell division protein ZapB [Candidatus Kentron sp. TUN]VFK54013.1 MAG: cell division protein ZapB [Candidatus Kentron sp. TUN]VFK58928.1 MAG: cell division protein ZapB [Candidatus Kentron sp. TUN]
MVWGTVSPVITTWVESRVESKTIQTLETRVDSLIRAHDALRKENQTLREQKNSLTAERATLIEKLELAGARVEAMVAQLKFMETGSLDGES